MENGIRYEHVWDRKLMNSDSDVFIGYREGIASSLRKEYPIPTFSAEGISLYHKVHCVLSKYEWVISNDGGRTMLLGENEINELKIKVISLDPQAISKQ